MPSPSWCEPLRRRRSRARASPRRRVGALARHASDRFALFHRRRSLTSLGTGFPLCYLTTTGRRTGEARTVPLLHVADSERVVLIASNWGRRRHPAWALNLDAQPRGARRRSTGSSVCTPRDVQRPRSVAVLGGGGSLLARLRRLPLEGGPQNSRVRARPRRGVGSCYGRRARHGRHARVRGGRDPGLGPRYAEHPGSPRLCALDARRDPRARARARAARSARRWSRPTTWPPGTTSAGSGAPSSGCSGTARSRSDEVDDWVARLRDGDDRAASARIRSRPRDESSTRHARRRPSARPANPRFAPGESRARPPDAPRRGIPAARATCAAPTGGSSAYAASTRSPTSARTRDPRSPSTPCRSPRTTSSAPRARGAGRSWLDLFESYLEPV